ncbi:MAG: hypothetical protein ACM3ZT_07470 [Bacillota bacterium]
MNTATVRVNKTLIRREFWENRSLWIVPACVLGLATLTGLIKIAMYVSGHLAAGNGIHIVEFDDDDAAAAGSSGAASMVRLGALISAVPMDIIMMLVIFFYLLDSLYADRRDRSVLFWRSMPVSDFRSVLAKLATAMFAATAITLAATIAMDLLAGIFELISETFAPHSIVLFSHPLALIEGWAIVAYALVAQAIWFLPFFGWWMLASAWAKKTPFLWATLPPVLLGFAELVLFRTHYFWHAVRMHVVNWMVILNIDPILQHEESAKQFVLNGEYVNLQGLGRYLASPELWIGTAIGAAFIYGAIVLRQKRSEI